MHQLMKKHLILAAMITTSSCLVSYSICAASAAESTTSDAGSKITRAADSTRQFAEGVQYIKNALKLKTP